MTERGPRTGGQGAPDPAEPPNSGDPPAPPGPPTDLGAVRRTDAMLDSLAAWRGAGSAARSAGPDGGHWRPADDHDPAVRLLCALITDVDDQGPGRDAGPEPPPPAPSGPGPGSRRRGPRTIVALGVAGAVLASTGVAAAGGRATDHTSATPPPSTAGITDDTVKAAPADNDSGNHEHPRTPVRPAPEPERPTTMKPPGDSRGDEDLRSRLRHPFPDRPRHRGPDNPSMTTQSAPAAGTDGRSGDDEDARRHLDDLRKRAQKRVNQYQNPDND